MLVEKQNKKQENVKNFFLQIFEFCRTYKKNYSSETTFLCFKLSPGKLLSY